MGDGLAFGGSALEPPGVDQAMFWAFGKNDGRNGGSSGTQARVRTRRLRRDPRCTLFVFDQAVSWLTLETTVSILDGPETAAQNLRLFRVMQNRPSGPLSWFGGELDEAAFLQTMVDEDRLIYEFEVHRSYGTS